MRGLESIQGFVSSRAEGLERRYSRVREYSRAGEETFEGWRAFEGS